MKLLILGAAGMLGQALVKEFAAEDIIVGDLPDFDLTKPKDLQKQIFAMAPEVIINAAAFTDVDGCETAKKVCFLVNGQAVGDLAKIAKNIGATLVHFSTDYVFNGQEPNGYKETDQPQPLNVYGQSKAEGENLLQQNADKFYLIRTAWLFGHGGKNFIDTIINLSNEKKELPVVNDQFGNPTYTKDLAAAIKNIILDKKPFGIYHQTNQGSCSWYELALKIKEINGLEINFISTSSATLPHSAVRPKYSILINNKLPALRPWEEALADYLSK
ncbi:MAG: dTDP-4-dehydrorhamnose reductase [Candidatus Komeilibacteria bacterium]|nr:dTDP-4-dehydrorhamnose reductase [Candidatus Komeilibacteria bacterium]